MTPGASSTKCTPKVNVVIHDVKITEVITAPNTLRHCLSSSEDQQHLSELQKQAENMNTVFSYGSRLDYLANFGSLQEVTCPL